MYEKSWITVLETCFAMTIFKDELNLLFLAQFGLLLGVKVMHWLAQERVEFVCPPLRRACCDVSQMEQTPNVTLKYHARMIGVLAVLGCIDTALILRAQSILSGGTPSSQLLFGFEVRGPRPPRCRHTGSTPCC